MTDPVRGRTALVTGGGSGLGAAMASHLVTAGARVVLAGRRDGPLRETAQQLGPDVRAEVCDVSDPASVRGLADRLADEQVSILVNNAGVAGPVAPLHEIDLADWDEVFAANVRGVYLVTRAFLPAMLERADGDVVNVSSVSGKRPLPRRTPYCASKAAVLGLTTSLAVEVGPRGVRVNSLSPGPVEGDRMERNFRLDAQRTGTSVEQAREAFVGRAALGRMVTADEVGRALVALLAIPGMTGADVDLSAGMIA
ncbi:SDR family NAD(P)-dependent oxidoreductase [Pseudonocardia sp. KRD291]|uniref:SDR family NAD(P)-dependent oxidoreductase n=1 Tax=Pseudonocardia sp. KRD291 TaxID=2792007 RepID=UPI001C4A6DC9|nr:SDR family oxidoreductase [Pseudonocardia sp. KRD291]MBW0104414.1 SDR family oxidoreductase [Pseudonocardia sp. KRD291]